LPSFPMLLASVKYSSCSCVQVDRSRYWVLVEKGAPQLFARNAKVFMVFFLFVLCNVAGSGLEIYIVLCVYRLSKVDCGIPDFKWIAFGF
jgi:hypothetical protein